MISRVFLATATDKELRNLTDFGTVEYLFDYKNRPRALDIQGSIAKMRTALRERSFDPTLDLVVLSGPLVYVVALVVAATMEYQRVRVAVFDAPIEGYVEKVLDQRQAWSVGQTA